MSKKPETEFEKRQANEPGVGVKPDGSPDVVTVEEMAKLRAEQTKRDQKFNR
jgi:hypothetical protein